MTLHPTDPLFILLIALVGALYSAVGHGGATGYLAVLALSTVSTKEASVLALVMNVFVATISFIAFQRAKHFSWSLTWPYLLGSVPLAHIGGFMKLPEKVYAGVLALALALAALRLFWQPKADEDIEITAPKVGVAVAVGSALGLLSGMVGIGGGVFLSPVLVLMRWATTKQASATAAIFIVCNSIAGLAARPFSATVKAFELWPVILAGIAGAVGGSLVGANYVANPWLRRTLSIVLAVAIVKLVSKI